MYLEPWMIVALIVAFGLCAYLNYIYGKKDGKSEGLIIGIEGAFAYLEKHGCIQFLKDGSIKGGKGKADVTGSLLK